MFISYNFYRLRYGNNLSRRRPRLLVGGINYGIAPNSHTLPLFRFADVVTLQPPGANFKRPDYVLFDPTRDRLSDVLRRLPHWFVPDLFWDCQVEHGHEIPRGLEDAPFPTVAGICHMWLSQSVPHVCQLFDVVSPLSKAFIPAMQSVASGSVLDLPFGGNWGSFGECIEPCWDKTLDLSVTFASSNSPIHEVRNPIIQLSQAFASKYRDRYRIEMKSGIPLEQYRALLRGSRITLNVSGVHGPYNYRLCEAMSAGALVFHYETPEMAKVSSIRDYFEDGRHLVVFDETNFERRLLEYLENPARTETVARAGHEHVRTNLSHDVIFDKIFTAVAKVDIRARSFRHGKADFHHGLAYWYQEFRDWQHIPLAVAHAVQHIAMHQDEARSNNLMVLLGWLSPIIGPAVASGLLGTADPDISGLLREGQVWNAIRALYRKAGADLVTRWNLAMLAYDYGKCDEVDYVELSRDLDAAGHTFGFDPMKVVLHTRSKNPAQNFGTWMKELCIPLMYKSVKEQMDIYREYMLACVRAVRCSFPSNPNYSRKRTSKTG